VGAAKLRRDLLVELTALSTPQTPSCIKGRKDVKGFGKKHDKKGMAERENRRENGCIYYIWILYTLPCCKNASYTNTTRIYCVACELFKTD